MNYRCGKAEDLLKDYVKIIPYAEKLFETWQ
jgi:hypothetical protein